MSGQNASPKPALSSCGRPEAERLHPDPCVEGVVEPRLARRPFSIRPSPAQAPSASAAKAVGRGGQPLEPGQDHPGSSARSASAAWSTWSRRRQRRERRGSTISQAFITATSETGPARHAPPSAGATTRVTRRLRLAAVPEHRLEQRARPAIVQVARPPRHRLGQPDPPERRSPPLPAPVATRLRAMVGQPLAHVMQQQVCIGPDQLEAPLRPLALWQLVGDELRLAGRPGQPAS